MRMHNLRMYECGCKTQDLGKLESFKRIPETLGTEIKHPADHPESNF